MKLSCFVLTLFLSPFALADAETAAAVEVVQKEMRTPKFREEAVKGNPQAAEVVKNIKDLAGSPENEQEIYNLAADVLAQMKDMTPEQMSELLKQAQQNPEAFYKNLSSEQKNKIKELSERIPAGKGVKP